MAIKSLETRLDEMTQVKSQAPGIQTTEYYAPEVPVDNSVPPLTDAEPLALPNPALGDTPIEMPAETSIAKPVLVAGGGPSVLREIVKGAEREAKKAMAEKPEAIAPSFGRVEPSLGVPQPVKREGELLIPEASDVQTQAVKAAVEARAAAREAGQETTRMPPEEVFNTTRMYDNIADIVNGTADAFGIKTERVTVDQIKTKANELGIDDKFINHLLTNGTQMAGNATNVYRAMQVLEESAKVLDELFAKVNAGQASEVDMLKLRQQITMHGLIQKSVKGLQTETARALAIMRVPRDANTQVIRQILDENGGAQSLQDLARAYMRTGLTPADKNRLLEKSMFDTVKDVWFTTWINGMLSSPVTHAKNIVGNMAFSMYRIPEQMLASAFSKMPDALRVGRESLNPLSPNFNRTLPMSKDDLIEFGDLISDMESFSYTVNNAFKRASLAFKNNAPVDGRSKMELEGRYDRNIDASTFGLSEDKWLGKAATLYGKAITLPGRMLMTEDEFFKSVFFDNYFRNAVNRRVRDTYKTAIEAGDNEASALAKSEIVARDLYANPPEDLTESALDYARRGTFTMDLPPGLAKLERMVQTPFLKMFVPFFRTPANIMLEVVERSPFAPVSSRFRQDFAKGGPARDLALAKVTLGSMAMWGMTEMAANGYIVGTGPMRKADKEAFKRAGGQPYSFVLPKAGFSEEQLQRLSSIGKVSLSDDKVYLSFAGLEPVGAMLAIGADYANFARYSDEADKINEVFGGSVYAMYNYMSNQPALQGFSDVMRLVGGVWGGEVNVEDFINGLSKQVGTFAIGGSPLGAYSSAVAAIERYLDPEVSDTSIKGLDLPIGVAGFYEAYLRAISRVPYYSDKLEPRLNLWGDTDMSGRGAADELIMPTRVTFGQFSPVDDELFQLGSPISMPTRVIDGVELDSRQYNQLLTIYAKELGAKQQLTELISTPGYTILRNGVKQQVIKKTHEELISNARKILVSRDPVLQNKIQVLKNMKQDNIFAKP